MSKLVKGVLCACLALSFVSQAVYAQPVAGEIDAASSASGPRKQMATIIFSGLAGAILGLSTLSFYGRPQDKLSNIAIGFAVGIIAGASFTTYKAATNPYDYIDSQNREGYDRWLTATDSRQLTVGYSWEF